MADVRIARTKSENAVDRLQRLARKLDREGHASSPMTCSAFTVPPRVAVSAGAARLQWKRFGRVDGKVGFEYIRDAPRDVSDVTRRLAMILLPRGWRRGIFAGFYHGALAFEQNVSRLQFGQTFNQDKFLMLRQHLQ